MSTRQAYFRNAGGLLFNIMPHLFESLPVLGLLRRVRLNTEMAESSCSQRKCLRYKL